MKKIEGVIEALNKSHQDIETKFNAGIVDGFTKTSLP